MAQYLGREGWLGIGIESSNGSPANPTDYIPYAVNSLIAKHTPIAVQNATGVREMDINSVLGKKWGEGTVTAILDPVYAGYWFKMALGTENKTTVSGTITDHLFTVSESATPTSASLIFDKVGVREQYCFSCIKDLTIDVKDGLATISSSLVSQFPVTTTSGTNSQTAQTKFVFKDLTAKFGATVSAAGSATATKLMAMNMKINTNVETIFRSGDNKVSTFANKSFEVTGEYDLLFEDTTELNNYYNLTKQACILTFTGATLGGAYYESIVINLYSTRINDFPIETGIDNLFSTKSNFVAEYSASDSKVLDVTCRNSKTTVY